MRFKNKEGIPAFQLFYKSSFPPVPAIPKSSFPAYLYYHKFDYLSNGGRANLRVSSV